MKKNNYIQFSKRLAVMIAIFWIVYRLGILAAIYFDEESAEHFVRLLTGIDDIMAVSIGFYTGNSVMEKGIVGYFSSKGAEYIDTSANG